MFANKFAALFTALVAAASVVSAAPAEDFEPHITAPTAGAVWHIGSTQNVTWDTSNIPPSNVNQTGLILLGYLVDGSEDEHLDGQHPLAVNFPITAGYASVVVPDVAPRDDYIVVLFGNSGNASPQFTITA
ncbi:hypothetical protein C8Q70DRAFT_105287 [Cubamyces menziesii]|uniref:Uncharacterized protein n=1 Tax=Trametes cubensis TaxID=1111947 RepID=A0AAD7TL56_9APHY|nr:hypothetical protein C8Q70DRAFT_105287 [Cubamyces menziesii]